ncbi:MAG: hypothetical protein R2744_13940 [Bacteroidales bacterium]
MIFESAEKDATYGHAKLGGIGELSRHKVKDFTAKYNNGKTINIINQKRDI